MSVVRISTPGQDRKEIDFTPGESLGAIFSRVGIDIPGGLEVWVNGNQVTSWAGQMAADNDAVVLIPALKGAARQEFVLRVKA